MAIATTNPTTGHVEKSFEPAAADEIEQHLARATSTFGAYRLTDLEARSRWMNNAADILDNEVDDIAALMTTEMGKTISSARAEVHKCADACRFFAANAVRFVADERVDASTVGARSDAVEGILRDERVRAVTLTGSESAGHSVASIAGSVGKPSVLELGGSDPFIVLPSADVDRAADVAVIVRTLNNGQSCIVAKRFIVDASVADQFERNFVARMKTLRVGDPFDETTDVGPVVNEEAREHLHEFVTDAVAKGARVLCGGSPLAGDGWFYPPTVVAEVTPDMRMFHEEVFGPVTALYRVNGVVEAIELAKATDFGLGSNVWTNDAAERERCIRDLRAGQVFVNGMTTSTPYLPFGGVKHSGYGRELSSQESAHSATSRPYGSAAATRTSVPELRAANK